MWHYSSHKKRLLKPRRSKKPPTDWVLTFRCGLNLRWFPPLRYRRKKNTQATSSRQRWDTTQSQKRWKLMNSRWPSLKADNHKKPSDSSRTSGKLLMEPGLRRSQESSTTHIWYYTGKPYKNLMNWWVRTMVRKTRTWSIFRKVYSGNFPWSMRSASISARCSAQLGKLRSSHSRDFMNNKRNLITIYHYLLGRMNRRIWNPKN